MTDKMTKKQLEKTQKMLDVYNVEQQIIAYQMKHEGAGTNTIGKVTRMSLAKKKDLLEELKKKYGDLPLNFPKVVL